MDISLEIEDYILNYRVAGLFRKDGKILVHHSINKTHVTLPGGRVKIGEDSITALKREIKEEIGKECEITKNVAVIENFFEQNSKKYHEILLVYGAEFKNSNDYEGKIVAMEAHKKGKLEFLWYDLKSDTYEFVPERLLDAINENKENCHIIINNRK